jgi:hypothetical protein
MGVDQATAGCAHLDRRLRRHGADVAADALGRLEPAQGQLQRPVHTSTKPQGRHAVDLGQSSWSFGPGQIGRFRSRGQSYMGHDLYPSIDNAGYQGRQGDIFFAGQFW